MKGKASSLVKEFKAFAMRGSVVDMAVGIVIGAGFGKIVTALVTNVIMPPIGMLLGRVDFANLKIVLKGATMEGGKAVPEVAIGYGMFINTVLDFAIVAFTIFLVIKLMNAAKKKEEAKPAPPPPPTRDQELLGEIRDLLKAKTS
jgi:large conductance mechanosensitive channel